MSALRRAPRTPQRGSVNYHSVQAHHSNPDSVVLLGNGESLYIHRFGNSSALPCQEHSEDCQYCNGGSPPEICHYLPCLLRSQSEIDPITLSPIWCRRVLLLPQASAEPIFRNPELRGLAFSMWRDTNPKTNETNRCGGIRYTPIGKAFDLEEPDFDVMALMLSVFYKTDAYRERRNEAYRHLREAVTPPVLNRPKTIAVPTIEERELARKQREHVRETLRQNGHVKIEKPTEMNVLDNGTGEILCEEYGEKMAAIKSKRKGAATEGGV